MPALALVPALGQQAQPAPGLNLVFLVAIFAVFYLLLIRPQQQRQKRQRELVRTLGQGDVVVTIGGIHGTIESLDEDTVRLEISPGTVITLARGAVARRLVDADEPATGAGA